MTKKHQSDHPLKPGILLAIASACLILIILIGRLFTEPLSADQTSSIQQPCAGACLETPGSLEIIQTPKDKDLEQVCDEEKGSIEEKVVTFGDGGSMNVSIYLPPCYDPLAPQGYAVFYLLHGQGFTNQQWIQLGIAELADRDIINGETDPTLIIFPEEKNNIQDPNSSDFAKTITDSLIPWVDQQYHTCTLRGCRLIAGISRGAAWAMHIGLTHYELFASIGAHSLTPFKSDWDSYADWLGKIPAQASPRIYIDVGNQDPYKYSASEFEQLLIQYKMPHEWHPHPGGHNEAYWRENIQEYLKWYSQGLINGT